MGPRGSLGERYTPTLARTSTQDIDKLYKKASALRGRGDTAVAIAKEIEHNISNNAVWSWAKHDALSGPMTDALRNVETFKRQSAFWQTWAVHPGWANLVKKSHNGLQAKKELDQVSDLESKVKALEKANGKILSMQEKLTE